jgi:valyl-tRNA synthetase
MSKSLGNVVDPLDIIEGTSLKRMIDRLKMSNLPDEEIGSSSPVNKNIE